MEKISTAGNEIILKDILEERRHHSDVVWVSKPFSPKQAYVKTNNAPNPLLFRYKMLTDKSIHSLIREVIFYSTLFILIEFELAVQNVLSF